MNTPEHTPLELTWQQAVSIFVLNRTYQQYRETVPLSSPNLLTEIEWETLINELLLRKSMGLLDNAGGFNEQGEAFIKTLLPDRVNINHWDLI